MNLPYEEEPEDELPEEPQEDELPEYEPPEEWMQELREQIVEEDNK